MKKAESRKAVFFALSTISFVQILFFNVMTPMLSDDYTYGAQVKAAHNLADLIRQEHQQYMSWIGRSVAHLLLRISLALPNILFKITNSLIFVILTWLIYDNVKGRRRYDCRLLLFITLLLWLTGVDFAQTVLWQTGACNYLWTTTIIFGMLTVSRHIYDRVFYGKQSKNCGFLTALLSSLGCLLCGIIAGWCSENTSGALLLILLAMNLTLWIRKHNFSFSLLAGLLGTGIGLYMMVSAPGNSIRAQYTDENYSGIAGYLARFEKLILVIREYFFPLLCLSLVLVVIRLLQERNVGKEKAILSIRKPLFWLFISMITSCSLIMAPTAMPRAHFGAGIFLILAVCQLAVDSVNAERSLNHGTNSNVALARTLIYSLLSVMVLYYVFIYAEDGTNLFRIHRDCSERIGYIKEQIAAGSDNITVAQVHPAFYNIYSAIDTMDLDDDPDYWINVSYEQYYGVDEIRAVPYDEWREHYKP